MYVVSLHTESTDSAIIIEIQHHSNTSYGCGTQCNNYSRNRGFIEYHGVSLRQVLKVFLASESSLELELQWTYVPQLTAKWMA